MFRYHSLHKTPQTSGSPWLQLPWLPDGSRSPVLSTALSLEKELRFLAKELNQHKSNPNLYIHACKPEQNLIGDTGHISSSLRTAPLKIKSLVSILIFMSSIFAFSCIHLKFIVFINLSTVRLHFSHAYNGEHKES